MVLLQILERLIAFDKELFLAINGWYSSGADFIMYWLSEKLIWAPWYAFLLFLLWNIYRKSFWYILPLIVLLVVLTDQVSVVVFKDVFERLRPCHELSLEGMVRILHDHCGGQYGFISSHATNTFGVAVFAGTLLNKRYKAALPVLLIWALSISYSRVYLGVHYPGDVLVGAMVGSLIGWLIMLLFRFILQKQHTSSQKNIF